MMKAKENTLKKSADILISLITQTIEQMDRQAKCESTELEQTTSAFANYIFIARALAEKEKRPARAKPKKEPVGEIILPPVMECDS